jgi:hypothetical protein
VILHAEFPRIKQRSRRKKEEEEEEEEEMFSPTNWN